MIIKNELTYNQVKTILNSNGIIISSQAIYNAAKKRHFGIKNGKHWVFNGNDLQTFIKNYPIYHKPTGRKPKIEG